jgi:hypothetical protein
LSGAAIAGAPSRKNKNKVVLIQRVGFTEFLCLRGDSSKGYAEGWGCAQEKQAPFSPNVLIRDSYGKSRIGN